MSSALTVIVLGQAYFMGLAPNISLPAPCSPTPDQNIEQFPEKSIDQFLERSVEQLPKQLSTTPFPDEIIEPIPEPQRLVRPSTAVIPEDYTYTPGIGVHKVHRYAENWSRARSVCQEEGGDLAVINSEAESKVINKLVLDSRPHFGTTYFGFAIVGFRYIEENDRWETVDGQTLTEAGFDHWYPGEPNNGREEDCGSIYDNGQLNNVPCRFAYAFVCELPDPVQGKPTAPTTSVPEFILAEQVTHSDDSTTSEEVERVTEVGTDSSGTSTTPKTFVPELLIPEDVPSSNEISEEISITGEQGDYKDSYGHVPPSEDVSPGYNDFFKELMIPNDLSSIPDRRDDSNYDY